ncbi:hypothetical protein CNMCM5793_007806 [Aspergillus hiratsukae]|uniref:Uncharacterized protein n=1 Tax=Aspergillus hiratsukae TaxID=1194566 RepID=A0A8H6P151_9EURO|nr:hypothetical protein CNMCM5793_007806 [Aspergillus hiratsukae]KAF7157815.1 hypothetical protein CNMCM6106_003944 [Aspergillus hiratsukae]
MPLFHRNSVSSSSSSARSIEEPNQRSHGLFGGRNSHSSHSPRRSSGSYSSGHTHRRGLLSRHHEDPSIAAAKEQVLRAESAEQAADRALRESRMAVREAKDHVKRLENEAAEEARLAKHKQSQARSISKRAKPLGRHV